MCISGHPDPAALYKPPDGPPLLQIQFHLVLFCVLCLQCLHCYDKILQCMPREMGIRVGGYSLTLQR